MEFWLRTSGTWINVLTVALGSSIGLTVGRWLPERVQRSIAQGIGLLTLWIGVSMTGSLSESGTDRIDGVILGLVAIVLGGTIGELLNLDEWLVRFGDRVRRWVNGSGQFTEGFVTASLLFCVGPMAFIGCLNNGLSGDNTLIVLKASMDGIAAIALSSIYGAGVGASVIAIALYQGGISLLAAQLAGIIPDPASDPRIFLLTGVGGLMVMGTGINLLELVKIRVVSFLPALAIAPLLQQAAMWLF